jgi:tetrapyrrole methylase family protein/MazG family protein
MIKAPTDKQPMDRLVKIMAALRTKQGCPWDKKQTHASLKPHLIEESYEVLEAIDSKDPQKLKEELGDLLLQSVFHAQLAAEKKRFTMNDVINTISDKLVRRHPHVFGTHGKIGGKAQLQLWEKIKLAEKGNQDRKSSVDGVPKGMPALLRSRRVLSKAGKARFEWNDKRGAWAKLEEELLEFKEASQTRDRRHAEEELGDVLMALVNVARYEKLEPEQALHGSIDKVIRRVHHVEDALRSEGRKMQDAKLPELLKHWKAAKAEEKAKLKKRKSK